MMMMMMLDYHVRTVQYYGTYTVRCILTDCGTKKLGIYSNFDHYGVTVTSIYHIAARKSRSSISPRINMSDKFY